MRIEVYEILATNSLSGSRIIINDNFKMLEEGLNSLFTNIHINEGKLSVNDLEEVSIEVNGNTKPCLKIDQSNGHIIILDKEGNLTIDVNELLDKYKNSTV